MPQPVSELSVVHRARDGFRLRHANEPPCDRGERGEDLNRDRTAHGICGARLAEFTDSRPTYEIGPPQHRDRRVSASNVRRPGVEVILPHLPVKVGKGRHREAL